MMNQLTDPVSIAINLTKLDFLKILVPAMMAFVVGIFSTPLFMKVMRKYDWQKKKNVAKTLDGKPATLTAKIDNDEGKTLYRAGGLVVLAGALTTIIFFRLLPVFLPNSHTAEQLNFLSRSQTRLPLFMLLGGAAIGFVDDMAVCGRLLWLKQHIGGGLSLKVRVFGILLMAGFCAWWLQYKLDYNSVIVPFFGVWHMGWLYAPFALLVILGAYGTSNIDGVDGLSGGLNAIAFATFGTIAMINNQHDIAALCFVMVGGLLAFLWFNIPPARFMNSETGYMGQILCIATVALFTGTPLLLPIVLLPAITAPVTLLIQLFSKKYRGKKVFLASPVHIHLQLIGWPKSKVTMRYWVIAVMCAAAGLSVFVLGGYL